MLQVGDYSITLKGPAKNKHFRIVFENGTFNIGQQTFDSLDELIEHYKKHPIFRAHDERLCLVKAFVHPSDVSGSDSFSQLAPPPPVGGGVSGDGVKGAESYEMDRDLPETPESTLS